MELAPLYQQVKAHVLKQMAQGELSEQSRVPSENELMRELGVSRMTVNRALNDLAAEGLVVRLAGVGTFVARQPVKSHPLQIRNIADEVRQRGNEHRSVTFFKGPTVANGQQARDFNIAIRARLYHSIVVHYENGIPVQFEDRLVNPTVAPDYLDTDFNEMTANEYLMKIAPFQKAEHILRATVPSSEVATALDMQAFDPCLLLVRRTWVNELIASVARLYYPGTRYEFAGHIAP